MKGILLCSLCSCGLLVAATACASGPQNVQEAAMVAQLKKAYAAQGLAVTPEAEDQFLQRYRQMQGGVIQAQILAGSVDKSTPAGAMAAMSAIDTAVRGDAPTASMATAPTPPPVASQPSAAQPSSALAAAGPSVATAAPTSPSVVVAPERETANPGNTAAGAAQPSASPLTQLPIDLQSPKTVWVPIRGADGATNWSNTYELYINGQRVRTPVGESVGGFISATGGSFIALVHLEPGSQAYRQLQQGTFQGDILTPNMPPAQHSGQSVMWAFYRLDADGSAQQMLGVAACSPQGQVAGTVRTEVIPEALFCHEAFGSNGEDALIGVSAGGGVLRGPTGYVQVFAAKDHFVGATRTVVRADAICMDTRAQRGYWILTHDNGRWTRGAQLVTINEAQKHIADIDRIESSSVYVDMPSYSPTWLTDVVTYQSHGEACSSLGPPDSVRGMGLLPELAQWVAAGASPPTAKQYHVSVGTLTEHGAGDAPTPLGAGLARHVAYGMYSARGSGGLGVVSALFGGGNNSIGLEFNLRSFTADDIQRLFRPVGSYALNYVSIQTPDDLYVVPLRSQTRAGQPGSEGQAYSVAAHEWVAADAVRAWLGQYAINQSR